MSKIILLNKPFNVLSQFSDTHERATLKTFLPDCNGFYPAGRLDYDSEGLLLLTDDGRLQQQISHPRYKLAKTYLAQVEGTINHQAISKLQQGIVLKDGKTKPAKAKMTDQPAWLWPRQPPVRYRASISTSWLELSISEGKNRQVRRMLAATGFPVLRLIRTAIGNWHIGSLQPGQHRIETVNLPQTGRRTGK